MPAPSDPTIYRLDLRATGPGPEPIRRLRAALKCLLRSYGLRCVHVEEIGPDGQPIRDPAPTGPK